MHKFCRREIRFAGTRYALFSYELRTRKRLNWFNFKALKDRKWRSFLRLTAMKPTSYRNIAISIKVVGSTQAYATIPKGSVGSCKSDLV